MRVRILGIGMGPAHITAEVSEALGTLDYVLTTRKGADDGRLALRRVVAAAHGVPVVVVDDPLPERDLSPTADRRAYDAAVAGWQAGRTARFEEVLRERGGTAGFLVWGDPALYDSTVRIVEELAERLSFDYDILPGISAPQLLAARHRIVLHPVGKPVHITSARGLHDAVAAGQENIVVLLGGVPDTTGLEDWRVWWGANLGAPDEQLRSGQVRDVWESILAAREYVRDASGWVMDIYLLQAP